MSASLEKIHKFLRENPHLQPSVLTAVTTQPMETSSGGDDRAQEYQASSSNAVSTTNKDEENFGTPTQEQVENMR